MCLPHELTSSAELSVCLGGTGGAAHEALVHHLPSANACSSVVWQLPSVHAERKGTLDLCEAYS